MPAPPRSGHANGLGVQRRALHVFDEAILLGDALLSYDAGHGRGPCQTLLLDEEFEGPETAAAGRDLNSPASVPSPGDLF